MPPASLTISKTVVGTLVQGETTHLLKFKSLPPEGYGRHHSCQGNPDRYEAGRFRLEVSYDGGPDYESITVYQNVGSFLIAHWMSLGDLKCVDIAAQDFCLNN